MRVTHVTWGYPSKVAGHEATYFANQVEGLARLGGATVNVVAPVTWIPKAIAWTSRRWRKRMQIPSEYEHNGVQVFRPRFVQLRMPTSWCCDLILLEGVIRRQLLRLKPDLVHIHGANEFGLAGLNAAKSLGVPSVLTLHGSDGYTTPFLSKGRLEIFLRAMRMPVRCIAVSLDLAEKASKLSGVQVSHLPLGIDMRRFAVQISKAQARDRFGLPRESRVVLYLGNLLPSKGVQVLLDALGKSEVGELGAFAGVGPMAPIIQQHPQARWLGPVTYADVPTLISAADVVVLPSFSEGLGLVLVEAGALGIPTIGTSVGGIPSLLSDERGYLVPVNDPTALSQIIAHVLTNPAEAKENAKRLREFVRENHDAEVNSAKLLRVYGGFVLGMNASEQSIA